MKFYTVYFVEEDGRCHELSKCLNGSNTLTQWSSRYDPDHGGATNGWSSPKKAIKGAISYYKSKRITSADKALLSCIFKVLQHVYVKEYTWEPGQDIWNQHKQCRIITEEECA